MPFPSKTALVTGATSGIGLALAERLIANGTFVIAVGRRQDRLADLVATHGADKIAAEPYDMTDLDNMAEWVKKITSTYPTLDTVILNAGIQRTVDFTNPQSISLPNVSSELTTNYLAPLHLTTHFLPHLQSLAQNTSGSSSSSSKPQGHIILVTSGLALVPIPRCPNYCATKSALHSLAWTLRSQLADHDASSHIRVIEVLPPAVQTELHSQQPDLVAAGQGNFGMPLDEFTEETWAELEKGELDEIIVGTGKRFAPIEAEKRKAFEKLAEMFKNGNTA
ncbi:short chain dehydrogenase [Colletotrichum truncatum]|uniref:Short chain dehydrogenase n=1 Tax=Colletotrichum truncatum TaxID=5467 RepID=A0ACC3ZFW4_COLTU